MIDSFPARFQRARRNARDPRRGGSLTQERFAELFSEIIGGDQSLTAATVSNWERGKARPGNRDRQSLWGIIAVLLKCRGLIDLCDANALLICGQYASLTEEEFTRLKSLIPDLTSGDTLEHQTDALLAAQDQVRNYQERGAALSGTHNLALAEKETQRDQIRLIAVRHQSMEAIPAQAIRESLPTNLRGSLITELTIDQTDLFRSGRLTDPLAAAQRQLELEIQLKELLVAQPDAQIAYYGIAHIPLLFLAGYQLSNRRRIALFDFNSRNRLWDQLQLAQEAGPLTLTGLPEQVVRDRGAVVVRMSISYGVTPEVVSDVIPEPIGSLHLALEHPKINVVTSEQQVWEYGDLFRQMMDAIHERFPRATGIHLFYSGPPPLAFYCGQQLSKTIHPQVIVYNYVARDTPNYSWGIDLMRNPDEVGFLVRPGQTPEATATV